MFKPLALLAIVPLALLLPAPVQCQTDPFQAALASLKALLTPKLPSAGTPFPKIPGPKCKDAKIGIVGAGPGGISMAYKMKKRGFTDVTILERTNRIGGNARNFELR